MNAIWLPRIDARRCTGSGECIGRCPVHALALVDGRAVLVAPLACTYCTECEEVCPAGAITLPFVVCFTDPLLSGPK